MLNKFALRRTHFLLALIPVVAYVLVFYLVSFLVGIPPGGDAGAAFGHAFIAGGISLGVFFIVMIGTLITVWIRKGISHAARVFASVLVLMVVFGIIQMFLP